MPQVKLTIVIASTKAIVTVGMNMWKGINGMQLLLYGTSLETMMENNASSLYSLKTEYNADSIEFCPFQTHSEFLTCGTYQLVRNEEVKDEIPSKNKRIGSLLLYKVIDDNKSIKLQEIQRIEMNAIPDMKWSHQLLSDKYILSVADANGMISLYEFDKNRLSPITKFMANNDEKLCLSLEWSNRINLSSSSPSSSSSSIVVSQSDGSVIVMSVDQQIGICEKNRWIAHEFEAWIATFNYWNPNIVYTDDCKLKGWDIRMDLSTSIFSNTKHEEGVCSIQSNPHTENYFISGSYDENVLLWDTRSLKSPVNTYNINGGVWRLKWHPFNKDLFVAACMYNGFHVIKTSDELKGKNDNDDVVITMMKSSSFMKHQSIAYGVDWSYSRNLNHNKSLLASCSFYDNLVHL
ncbi:17560_t:CDS:10, partial [Entrophospora sp. SA101]